MGLFQYFAIFNFDDAIGRGFIGKSEAGIAQVITDVVLVAPRGIGVGIDGVEQAPFLMGYRFHDASAVFKAIDVGLKVVVGRNSNIPRHPTENQGSRCIIALLNLAAVRVADQYGQVQVVVLDARDAFVGVGSLVAVGIVAVVDAASRGAAIGFGFGPEAFEFEHQVAGLFVDA